MSNSSNKDYDLIIIGGGLGGLLSGALATQHGISVLILEQLSFLGGRFTSFDVEGYALPSGAVHMIPYGLNGPMGDVLLRRLKLDIRSDLKLKPTQHFTGWKWKDLSYEIRCKRFFGAIKAIPGLKRKSYIVKMLKDRRNVESLPKYFSDYLMEKFDGDKKLKQFFLAMIGFSLSLNLEEILTEEVFAFLSSQYNKGSPAIPIGGCKKIIEVVRDYIISEGQANKIYTNYRVTALDKIVNGFKVSVTKNPGTSRSCTKDFSSTYVISDIGPQATAKVVKNIVEDEQRQKINQAPTPSGFGLAYGLEVSVLGHSGITLTPGYQTLCGLVEPTHIDSFLAPKGHHLLLTHHVIPLEMSHEEAIRLGREEIKDAYPDLQKKGKELTVHSFKHEWGVNKTTQGFEFRDIGVAGLWLVGDGSKRKGMIMTEGVADSVLAAMNSLKHAIKEENTS